MRAAILLALGLFLVPSSALAATLSIRVTDPSGKPARDVVVALRPIGRPAPAPHPLANYRITQEDTEFHPFISVVPVGTTVSFPNLDPFKHHVYSFSSAKRFELKLFAKDQSRSVLFDKAGVVAIGCNIHDSMSAFIYVTDTALTAGTGSGGNVSFPGMAPGRYTLTVWHPFLNGPGNQQTRDIMVTTADHSETVSAKFRTPPPHNMSNY